MSRKKENLLEHAEQLFYEHGFHAIGFKPERDPARSAF